MDFKFCIVILLFTTLTSCQSVSGGSSRNQPSNSNKSGGLGAIASIFSEKQPSNSNKSGGLGGIASMFSAADTASRGMQMFGGGRGGAQPTCQHGYHWEENYNNNSYGNSGRCINNSSYCKKYDLKAGSCDECTWGFDIVTDMYQGHHCVVSWYLILIGCGAVAVAIFIVFIICVIYNCVTNKSRNVRCSHENTKELASEANTGFEGQNFDSQNFDNQNFGQQPMGTQGMGENMTYHQGPPGIQGMGGNMAYPAIGPNMGGMNSPYNPDQPPIITVGEVAPEMAPYGTPGNMSYAKSPHGNTPYRQSPYGTGNQNDGYYRDYHN